MFLSLYITLWSNHNDMTRQKARASCTNSQALHQCPATHVSFLASASAAQPMRWVLFLSSWWKWGKKKLCKEDSQMCRQKLVHFCHCSGASSIHQPELIARESGVSWQDAAPAAITIRNRSSRPRRRQRAAARRGQDLPKGWKSLPWFAH